MRQLVQFIAILALSSAVLVGYIVFQDQIHYESANRAEKFEIQWRRDTQKLHKSKIWSRLMNNTKVVDLRTNEGFVQKWLENIKNPVLPGDPEKGKNRLEIFVMHWKLDDEEGIILQYNWVDIKSNNMFYELGRTLTF